MSASRLSVARSPFRARLAGSGGFLGHGMSSGLRSGKLAKFRPFAEASIPSSHRKFTTVATNTPRSISIMPSEIPMCPVDKTSFANTDKYRILHVQLNLAVDFERKVLGGSVVHTVRNEDKTGAWHERLVLDTRGLKIEEVALLGEGDAPFKLEFSEAPKSDLFGTPLLITIPSDRLAKMDSRDFRLRINYETTASCTACQWLTKEQTVGGKLPYMFTQCQAIHARSLVPIQDTPSVKLAYSAEVKVPSNMRAVMSAVPKEEVEVAGGFKVCKFEQKITIPSYLIALAVGNLVGKRVGPRSTVWSEPEVIEKAAWEFVDTESFVKTGEELLTPYVWGVYDLLILPASFPYGGMENPCITFATPSLLAGDRSLVDVVAHEIAHSWMGNLVTTASWDDFWLNEGFTVTVERKIMGKLHGKPAQHFSAIIGEKALRETVERFENIGQAKYTSLVQNLDNEDPDDAFSTVPYEKGFHFLFYLEEILGGEEVFNGYLRDHVNTFSHKSITTSDFKKNLYKYFANKTEILDKVDWQTWLYGTGMPPVKNEFDQSLANACTELAKRWDANRPTGTTPTATNLFSPDDIESFTSNQIVVFLERLQDLPKPLPAASLDVMDKLYGMSARMNMEIRYRWLEVCMRGGKDVEDAVEGMVTTIGRMKYVRPLYRAWNMSGDGMRAKKCFEAYKTFYHPICRAMVEKDLYAGGAGI